MYKEVEGNLITLAKQGAFDVITHGCNCMCNMGAGIAPQMDKAFGCSMYPLEHPATMGDINKLGQIDSRVFKVNGDKPLVVVNSYSQYVPSVRLKPLDYEALTLCLRKINFKFKGKHIGLPKIGAGLAGGDWDRIKEIIKTELCDCDVTVVIYKP